MRKNKRTIPDGYVTLPWGEVAMILRVLEHPENYSEEVVAACRLAEEARRRQAANASKEKAPAA